MSGRGAAFIRLSVQAYSRLDRQESPLPLCQSRSRFLRRVCHLPLRLSDTVESGTIFHTPCVFLFFSPALKPGDPSAAQTFLPEGSDSFQNSGYNPVMSMSDNLSKGHIQNRYYPRMDIEVLLAYRPLSAPEEEGKVVKSRSFGLGGIMFEDENQLPPGAAYILDLVLGEMRVKVRAKVVYSKRIRNKLYQNGFSFSELDEKGREHLTNFFLQEYEQRPP